LCSEKRLFAKWLKIFWKSDQKLADESNSGYTKFFFSDYFIIIRNGV